jgi:hypothetical protein
MEGQGVSNTNPFENNASLVQINDAAVIQVI